MELYDKGLTKEDSREENGVKQIRLDGVWYDVPKPGEANIQCHPETFQAVLPIGPWWIAIEPMLDEQAANG